MPVINYSKVIFYRVLIFPSLLYACHKLQQGDFFIVCLYFPHCCMPISLPIAIRFVCVSLTATRLTFIVCLYLPFDIRTLFHADDIL